MSKHKPVLGRGLDALIRSTENNQQNINNDYPIEMNKGNNSGNTPPVKQDIGKLPIKRISPNPFNPRTVFDPKALEELKASIIANGLIQPITVRPHNGDYQLISGERRLRAFTEIGYSEIPAYIIEVASDELMLAMALIENIQRERLNAIEEALAYKRLVDECSLTQDEISERVGKNRTTIANSMRLLKLPSIIQDSLVKDDISSGHARALINLPNEKVQIALLQKIIKENLSVRKVEALVKQYLTEGPEEEKISSELKVPKKIDSNALALEEKIRGIFGTKVNLKTKAQGKGEIVIEYFSDDELIRLIEMFEIIEKHN